MFTEPARAQAKSMTDQDIEEAAAGSEAAVPPHDVTKEDLEALGDGYAADSSLADELRDGFRDVKRAQGEARRLLTLLRGLIRKTESEAHRTAEDVTRLVEAIQRRGEEN
jgi:hypothetical protein